jgi:uncharacterized membrane protein YoaK (UPF0700 family)
MKPQHLLAGRVSAAGLAFVAGFADAFAYLRWHAFAANMTGNTVIFAVSLYRDAGSALVPLMLILVFVAGSILGRAIVTRFAPAIGLFGEAALLIAGAFTRDYLSLDAISMAMAVQNASIARFAGVRANTSFITGDYNRIGQAIADIIRSGSDESRRTISVLFPVVMAYVGGALASALGSSLSVEILVVIPIVLALAFAVQRGALK